MTDKKDNAVERLQAARQEAAGRRRANVLIETKDLSTLLDRCKSMTEEQKASPACRMALIEELRSEGYAIAILTPEEVGDADPDNIEDIMRERGLNCAATAED